MRVVIEDLVGDRAVVLVFGVLKQVEFEQGFGVDDFTCHWIHVFETKEAFEINEKKVAAQNLASNKN